MWSSSGGISDRALALPGASEDPRSLISQQERQLPGLAPRSAGGQGVEPKSSLPQTPPFLFLWGFLWWLEGPEGASLDMGYPCHPDPCSCPQGHSQHPGQGLSPGWPLCPNKKEDIWLNHPPPGMDWGWPA
jgi:hypothetical protein